MNAGAQSALDRLKVDDIHPGDHVRDLSVNQLQLVEIAKALSVNADIIVMDEPTAALPLPDVHKLFDIVRDLKASGSPSSIYLIVWKKYSPFASGLH